MSFAYPSLSLSEIVDSLSELLGIQLEEQWLKKPDPLQWQDIYARMVEEVMAAPEDWYYQTIFQEVEIENPDLQAKSFPLVNLASGLKKIMPSIGLADFSVGDILFPTTHRLRKICSAVTNYLRFKHTRLPYCEEMKADIEMDRERHDMLLKRNEELKNKIKQLKAEKVDQEPLVAQANEAINKKSAELQDLQRAKQQKQKEIQDIKTRMSTNTAKIDQVRCSILKANDEADHLSQKIVVSPDKVRAEQEHLAKQVVGVEESLNRKQIRLSDLRRLRDNYKHFETDVQKGVTVLEGIQAENNKESEIDNQLAQIRDKIQEESQETRDVDNKNVNLQQMLTMRQENSSKLSIQHQSRMKVLHEQFELLNQQKEKDFQKQSSQSERQTELMNYNAMLEEERKKMEKIVNEQIATIMDKYAQLIEQGDKCHVDIGTVWNNVRSDLKR